MIRYTELPVTGRGGRVGDFGHSQCEVKLRSSEASCRGS